MLFIYIYMYIYIYIYTHTHTHTHTLNNLVIFYIVYHLIYFTINIINFNILIIYEQYLLNLPQTTLLLQALINKELYDCKWDPTTLTNKTSYTTAFGFL
jgi:hypothetical protein